MITKNFEKFFLIGKINIDNKKKNLYIFQYVVLFPSPINITQIYIVIRFGMVKDSDYRLSRLVWVNPSQSRQYFSNFFYFKNAKMMLFCKKKTKNKKQNKSQTRFWPSYVEVSKKTDKPIKLRKPKKNNRKNRTEKKNRVNRLKNYKKILVRFGFGFQSLKPINRTEPNRFNQTNP